MISVVVPTFNSEKTIFQTISSILNQSYEEFEIIIIDNHSTDSTKAIVESFDNSCINFYLIRNQGMPAISRNYGISIAKYDYVAFCDSDDFWEKDKLISCVDCIKRGFSFIAHDLKISGSLSKSLWNRIFFRQRTKTYSDFIEFGNSISQSSVVIKRKILLDLGSYTTDPRFIAVEDAHLWAKILKSGVELCYIKKRLVTLRYSDYALSSSANQFRAHRSLRLEYFSDYKPAWYKYNIAIYLLRKKMYRRGHFYLRSLLFSRKCPLELRLKSLVLLARLCIH